MSTLRQAFAGRDSVIDDLKRALEESLAGQGQIVMLVGEAGIGKTSAAEEVTAGAEQQGALTLWGWCYEEQGTPPYWPWVRAIRSYILDSDPKLLAEELGLGAADIAQIIPEIYQKMPDLEPSPELNPDQARFRLFDSITKFLKALAAKQPLVLVLDDLHYADKPSTLLLQFAAPEIGRSPILLIGCYRDTDLSSKRPLTDVLGGLHRERSFHQVHLQNLTQEDVKKLIENAANHTVPQWVAESVYRLTSGNPFFVHEVVRSLAQEGKLTAESMENREDWSIGIPGSVRDVILNRVNNLSPNCRNVLEIASVIGREFAFLTLGNLFDDLEPDDLLEALEEARKADLIGEIPDTAGYYRFTHAILQRTILEGNSSTKRALMHSQVAKALEDLHLSGSNVTIDEMVHHFGEAKTVLGGDKFVQYSIIAGEDALEAYAPEEALVHFQQALDARQRHPTDNQIASILFGLGRAQAATGQTLQAWLSLKRAFDYYIDNGDIPSAVHIAEYPIVIVPGDTERVRLISSALEKVPADSHHAGRLLATYGRVLYLATGEYDKAKEAFERALVIAQRENDASLETRIKAYSATVDIDHMLWDKGIAECQRALEQSQYVSDLKIEVRARYDSARAMCAKGNLEGARPVSRECLAQADKLRDSFWFASSIGMTSILSRLEGQWELVRSSTNIGLSIQPSDSRLLGLRTLVEYETGELENARTYLNSLLETMHLATGGPVWENAVPALVVPIIAYMLDDPDLLEVGDNAAQDAAEKVLSSPFATPELSLWATTGLALIASIRGDTDSAQKHYSPLSNAKQQSTRLIAGIISIDRVLGMIAKTTGHFDEAEEYLKGAQEFCERNACLPELAWSYFDHASVVAAREERRNEKRVNDLLGKALELANSLGMNSLIKRATELQEAILEPSGKRPKHPADLTPREVEVLKLIAQGKSNYDVADELTIALNTVIRHASNIYIKTDSRNRTEAAAFAMRNDLL